MKEYRCDGCGTVKLTSEERDGVWRHGKFRGVWCNCNPSAPYRMGLVADAALVDNVISRLLQPTKRK